MITWLSFPLLFSVAIFADQIIVLLFGETWIESGFYLETLTFAGVFLIIETLLRNYIKALCEVKKLMCATIIKRIVGIGIMIGALMIKPEYIVYGYIISAFVGYLINALLYIELSKVRIVRLFVMSFGAFLICLIYYMSFKFLICANFNIFWSIGCSVVTLLSYYMVVLPKLGINLLSIITRNNEK